ncbi:hypothetical protein, partial [Nonomuraea sp. NPDC023979]|uniref:hypothetical protein n=1 Tax=Nonomuraea sp. NPDC023979 TaxID=3154796 RepID=UPI0033CAA4FC
FASYGVALFSQVSSSKPSSFFNSVKQDEKRSVRLTGKLVVPTPFHRKPRHVLSGIDVDYSYCAVQLM